MTLAEFLLARIAEDEGRANVALSWWPRHGWEYTTEDWEAAGTDDPAPGWAELIAAWEPTRVLAECEARRRIIYTAHHAGRVARDIGQRDQPYLDILGYLALPYADHSDYRQEWAEGLQPTAR